MQGPECHPDGQLRGSIARAAVSWQAMLGRGLPLNCHAQACWFVAGAHSEAELAESVAAAGEAFAAVRRES